MSEESRINRRQFFQTATQRAGLLAAGTAALQTTVGSSQAASKDKPFNPFAYDIGRLEKTDPKLIAYEEVSKFPSGDQDPRRIAVGPDRRLYVAGKNGLTILEPDGTKAGVIPLGLPGRCVAVAGDGTVYVGVRDHIEVFDAKHRRLSTWESPGKKCWFSGLAVSDTDVFAADSGNRVVLRYDRSGKLGARIGEKNKDRNVPGLILPSPYLDVAIGRDGLLRVNNTGRHSVELYTASGDFELCWGKPSAGIEGFCGCCNPVALALLPDGRCITCEKGLPRVKVHSADGTFENVVAGPESFPANAKPGSVHNTSDGNLGGLDAAVDGEGRVYVLDLVTGDVRVMKRKAAA